MRAAWLLAMCVAVAITAAAATVLVRWEALRSGEETAFNSRKFAPRSVPVEGPGLSVEADLRYRAARSELPARRKIRDGEAVPDGGFPDVAWLHTSSTPLPDGQDAASGVCTGTLVAPDAIVTALHCVCSNGLKAAMFGNSAAAADRQWIALKTPQPDWSACDGLFPDTDDVALVRLERPVAGIAPRALAPAEMIDAAYAYTIIGFGSTGTSDGSQGIKRGTTVGRVSASCSGEVPAATPPRSDSLAYGCRPGREIVAGAMPDSSLSPDTCPGDSGGPLYVSPDMPAIGDPPESGLRLAGVTSRPTAQQQQQCGDGGIYVRLTGQVRAWLEAELARP